MVITTRARKRRRASRPDEQTPDSVEAVEDFEPKQSDQSSDSSVSPPVLRPNGNRSQSQLGAAADDASQQLCWTERYSDIHSQTGLVVSTKKFNEIVQWLRLALEHLAPRFLVLSGPPGCGKRSAVFAACEKLACKPVTWDAPLTASTGISASLIEDFNSFVVGTRYTSLLSASNEQHACNGSASPPPDPATTAPRQHVLVIDDLPLHISDLTAHAESIQQLFRNIARFAPYPAILLLSDNDKGIHRLSNMVLGPSLLSSQWIGSISVPPVTTTMLRKRLHQILASESMAVPRDQLDVIISSSNGDIRSALNNLQLSIIGAKRPKAASRAKLSHQRKKRPRVANQINPSSTMQLDRDTTLSTYHAISKILNNKRCGNGRSQYVAEQILDEARVDPSTFISFLHHNYPDFFGNSDDVVPTLTCLSEADTLLPWRQEDDFRVDLRECAASIVTRGFLYFNTQPNRNGWRPIRGPESHKIRQASRNHVHYTKTLLQTRRDWHLSTRSDLCETLPYAKKIREFSAPGCLHSASDAAARQTLVCSEDKVKHVSSDSHPTAERGGSNTVSGDVEVEDHADPIEEWSDVEW